MFLLFNFQERSWSCVPLGRNCDLGPEISVCFLSCFVWRKQEEVGLIGAVLACHSPSLAMNFMRVKACAFTRTSSPLRGELLLGYNGRYD